MTKRCFFLFLILLHFLAEGQVHSVKLLNSDTTICAGSPIVLQSSFSLGSFRYFATYGGKDYFVDTVSRGWMDAKEEASRNGLELWVIDNLAENNTVYELIPYRSKANTYFWIGLYQDQSLEGTSGPSANWKWVDGRSLDITYKNWYSNEPDDIFLDVKGAGFASLGLLPTGFRWSDMTNLVPPGFGAHAIAEIPASTISISWSSGEINKIQIDPKPLLTSSYTVDIVYKGVKQSSNQVNVTVSQPKTKASFEVDPSSVNCLSKNYFKFLNTSSATSSLDLTTFKWDFGDGSFATGIQVTHQYSGVQSYTIKLTATDELGCSSQSSSTVSVISSPLKPVISMLSGAPKFCVGDSVVLSTVVQQPDPATVFSWYRETSLLGSQKTIVVKLDGDYLLEVTSSNGCRDSAIIQLSTFQLPTRPLITTSEGFGFVFCQGDSTVLKVSPTPSPGSYKWEVSLASSFSEITDAATNSLTVKAPGGMVYSSSSRKYRVAFNDENNCSSPWSEEVEVLALPAPSVTISAGGASTTICEGSTVPLKVTSLATMARSIWTRDDIVLKDGLDPIWYAGETGSYRLNFTNSFGCQTVSNNVNVLVNKLPPSPIIQAVANIPEIVSPQEMKICPGAPGTLRVAFFSGATYQWFKDEVPIAGAVRDTFSVVAAGTYKVSTTLVGCASLSKETKIGFLPLPTGTMLEPDYPAICFGSDRLLTATGASGYQWYYNYVPIQGATGATYRALTPGVYQVEFSSNKGCKKMSPNFINLNLIRKPNPRFSVDIYCTGSEATFTNLSQTANSGSVNYLWKFQNGQLDSNFSAKHTFNSSGLYKVCLEVIPVACPQLIDSSVVNLQIEAAPKGVGYTPINALSGKSVSLVARPIGDFYEWKPSAGLNSPYIRIPVLNTPPKEQLFTVDITTRSGCRTVDTLLVRVFDAQEIYVAGGFTPNNDGNNDKAYPILVGVAAFRYMKIFNRWGVQVFQTASTDPEQGWDGTYRGVPQPADTYTWVISAVGDNGREIQKSGSLVLIR